MSDDVPRLRPRPPWVAMTLGGAAVVAAVVIVVVVVVSRRPVTPEERAEAVRARAPYVRPLPPPRVDAYRTGGVPLRDPTVEAILVALADGSVRNRQLVLGEAPFTGAPAEAWKRLLAAWDGWLGRNAIDVRAELAELADAGTGEELDDLGIADVVATSSAESELRAAVRAFDAALAGAGLGYFVEARIRTRNGDAQAFLRAFRVEEVTMLRANDRDFAVPYLRQIDNVSVRHAAMGLESPDLGAIAIADPVARYAITDVLPALAADGAFKLGTTASPIAKLVGETVRREVSAALGSDAVAARTVAERLARRQTLTGAWRVVLRKHDGVYLPADDLVRIAPKVPQAEYAEVLALEDELERLEAPRIASRLEQLVAASVRRHELAHLLDRARATPLPVPRLLDEVSGRGASKLVHARAELVGYLSQLIDDPVTPHLTLWGAAAPAFESASTAEGRAGRVILTGLARQAGLAEADQRPGEHYRVYLARIAEPLARLDGATLRRHARALWTELYGEDHAAITDRGSEAAATTR